MQEFNTPKTGEGASPVKSLAFHMAGYRAGLAKYIDLPCRSEAEMAVEKARLIVPHEAALAAWDAPADTMGTAVNALRLLREEITDNEPTPLCAPLLTAALGFFENAPRARHVDASDAYWLVREALGVIRLIQGGLDAILEEPFESSEKADRLRDMEQASAVAGRTLDRALGALEELEKLEIVGGAA